MLFMPDDLRAGNASQMEQDKLETGVLRLGSTNQRTGTAILDSSSGPSYGCGHRYDWEETPTITKVPPVNNGGR